jgi:hypothetical protein
MSTKSARQQRRGRNDAGAPADTALARSSSDGAKPLKPRRALFTGLMIALAIWVGLLLWLYFTTVYPQRHH